MAPNRESNQGAGTAASERSQPKTIIITGGGSGIGLAAARVLLASNYRVVLLGKNRAKLETAAQNLGGSSDKVSILVCDLADAKDLAKAAEKIQGSYKGIYGLVNNAGVYPLGGLADTTDEVWEQAMQVNLKAPFVLIRAIAASMAKNRSGGRIINISSTAGILPSHFALAYSVSKAGLIHLTRTLAKELGKDNITVNCICPGIVRTPLHDGYHATKSELEEFYAKRGSNLPLGRVGEPQDVVGSIQFFLSEQASWITGETLVVDGGRLLS